MQRNDLQAASLGPVADSAGLCPVSTAGEEGGCVYELDGATPRLLLSFS